ncbi:MAG: cation transporter [Clostridia bacterium]|nr:cation transporter [Clostridia bacterium]
MTDLLVKLFIKDKENTKDTKVRGAYALLASIVGISLNVLLFIAKLTIGIISLSVAIIADAFNNITDAASSVISLIGFKLSEKPTDKEHPMGHGRLEYVSAFIVDMIIVLVGFELFTSSLKKIFNPEKPNIIVPVFIFLAISVIVKLWLFFFYSKIAKKISASAVKASALDSLTDAVATLLVLVSSLLSYFGILESVPLDGGVGILVACYILYSGIKAAKETIDLLLGAAPDEEFVKEISEFYKDYPEIIGIHDLMIHDYGPGRRFISFHAEVPSDSDIEIAHEAVDKMERDMFLKFNSIVTIHLDPLTVNDEKVNEMREFSEACAREVSESFTIHDFRMTDGAQFTNLIFDLLVPADSGFDCESAEKLVTEKIKEKNPACFAVIKAEHPYI